MNRREAIKAQLAMLATPAALLFAPKPKPDSPAVKPWPEPIGMDYDFWSPKIVEGESVSLWGRGDEQTASRC